MPRGRKRMPGDKPPRGRIIMVRRARPKVLNLPDSRTFKANFRRATRADLPRNVDFPRIYKQRATPKGKRRRQHGRGFKSALGKAFRLAKKVAGSQVLKNIGKAGLDEIPGAIGKQKTKMSTRLGHHKDRTRSFRWIRDGQA